MEGEREAGAGGVAHQAERAAGEDQSQQQVHHTIQAAENYRRGLVSLLLFWLQKH